jgi:exonuclease III
MIGYFICLVFFSGIYTIKTETYCPIVSLKDDDRRENKNLLRIMQYNVEWLFLEYYKSADCPGNGCTWKNESHAQDHLMEVANVINKFNPDIINLSEVESCDELNSLKEQLNSKAYESFMVQGTDSSTGQNVGMITKLNPSIDLYRENERIEYPIENTFCFTDETGTEGVSKHFITEFNIQQFNIAFISIHLLAYPDKNDRCVKREAQAMVLEKIIENYSERNYEVIVIGDFNDYDSQILDLNNDIPISQVLSIIKGVNNPNYNLFNVNQDIEKQARYSNWWDKNNNNNSTSDELVLIDHILLSEKLYETIENVSIYHGYYENSEKIDSDHFPIILDLIF